MESLKRPLLPKREPRRIATTTTEKVCYNRKNASDVLEQKLYQHNEAKAGRGLKYLRSFLSKVVGLPGYSAAKPILTCLNGKTPESAVDEARRLLAQQYEDATSCFVASQIALTVKKYPFDGMPAIAREHGLRKFKRGERRNRHMNALFRARRRSGVQHKLMAKFQHHVANILGNAPDLSKWTSFCGWGPGSCVGVSGKFTNFARKLLSSEWTVTPTCLPYALTLAKRLPFFWEVLDLQVNGIVCIDPDEFERRFMVKVKLVDFNKLAAVPKDADEDRIIASEPLLNQLCQMAADMEMRLHLRRFGIDLRDQERNQLMAREGSLGGFNARCTVDLSNASGSIFIELVREATAMVPEWFICLNAIRSPAYVNPFEEQDDESPELRPERYQMFSSMGNGFTFPLETIIFAAICLTAHDYCGTTPDYRCYGDDIIIRQNEALVVLELLRDFGFKANTDKTFVYGPFRESCGADWYNGEPVRPIVFDTKLDLLEERVRIHNALVRLPNAAAAELLSGACADWFPPFMSDFVRPFADHTDEAIDGRYFRGPYPKQRFMCKTYESPAWYGMTFSAQADKVIMEHRRYPTALLYAAVGGATSATPFAARRETRLRVTRFSHSGNTSSWLPAPGSVPSGRNIADQHVLAFRRQRSDQIRVQRLQRVERWVGTQAA